MALNIITRILKTLKAMKQRDEGFTLIELLVVSLIIGVLASIAVPTYNQHRKTAIEGTIKNDVRNLATFVDNFELVNNKRTTEFPEEAKLTLLNYAYVFNNGACWTIDTPGYTGIAWSYDVTLKRVMQGPECKDIPGSVSSPNDYVARGTPNGIETKAPPPDTGVGGVTVTNPSSIALSDTFGDVIIDAQTTSSLVGLGLEDKISGGTAPYKISVTATNITMGQLFIDGYAYNLQTKYSGTQLGFKPQVNTATTERITIKATDAAGAETSPKTISIIVRPVAVNDSVTVSKYTGNRTDFNNQNNNAARINVGANDKPMNFGGTVTISQYTLDSACGDLLASQPDIQNGIIRWLPPATAQTCTLTYVIKSNQNSVESVPAKVTIIVN
jgi:prepilin-type N-terminal cleavage/methylation domain-containing protein